MFKKTLKSTLAFIMTLAMMLTLLPAITLPASAAGTTIYVNSGTGNDASGDGSAGNPYKTFTKGYSMAASGDTLDLTGTFTWTDADETGDVNVSATENGFYIEKNIILQGHGAGSTIIQAASSADLGESRLFRIDGIATPRTVTFNDLELRYGKTTYLGGAFYILGDGDVTINNCYIHDNIGYKGGCGLNIVGALNVTIRNSTISNNSGPNDGNGGGINVSSSGTLVLTNTTICGNSIVDDNGVYGNNAVRLGAGIYMMENNPIVYITNCTIAENTTDDAYGAGIAQDSGTLYLKNTIIANNTSASTSVNDYEFYAGTLVDNGYNIIEYYSSTGTGSGALTGTTKTGNQASLNLSSTLADNGGSTLTLALESGSIAINAGDSSDNGSATVPSTDQRGFNRDANYDIGAYEFGASSAAAPTVTTQAVSSIGTATAAGNGNITALGSDNPTAYGVCWNTAGTPTTADSKTDEGVASATGAFTSSITGLTANTTYYVRAYATNTVGTSYGAQVSFTTSGPEINITGNGTTIADGDATPSAADHTDFGSVATASGTVVREFTIQNTGTAALTLTSTPAVSIGGANPGDFTVTAAPTTPVAATESTTFQITFDPSAVGTRSATVSIANDDGDENPFTFSIQGAGLNTAPTVSGLPTDIEVTEDTSSEVDLSAAVFSDADGDALTVTLTASAGTFTASSGGSVTVGNSGTGALTLTGTAANINTYLDTASNIKYTGALNASGNDAATFTVNVNDGTVNPALGTVNIDITAVNDDPAMTGLPTDITVTEDTASNVDLSAVTLSDADSGAASITLTLAVGAGTLTASSGGGVTVSGSGSGTLTLTGTAANIDMYLNTASNIKYTGAADAYGNDVTALTLTANDGNNTGTGGGGIVSLGTVNIDITAEAPTVTNVTSTKLDGTYGAGDTIEITVTFSDTVTVTGTPQLTLETGAADRTINYSSGTGTDTLTFTYTVQTGDESADLDYTATNALSLNGGTIKRDTTNATLTLPSPGGAGSLGANKALVINALPTVSLSVGSASIAENGGTSTVTATLSAVSSQNVVVTLSYTGTATNGTDYNGTASTTITIPAGDLSANAAVGITAADDALSEGPETIVIDIMGVSKGVENGTQQKNITILDDDSASVSTVSSTTANGSYKAGDVIAVTVTFTQSVTVTGTPQLSLETGTTDRVVDYSSGSGTPVLTFNYTIQAGDTNADLDYLNTSALSLNGGTIQNSGMDAVLTLPTPGAAGSLGANKAIIIDTTAPTASIVVADSALKAGETSLVTITFSEAVTGFTNTDLTAANGSVTAVSSADGGITYTATFTPTADIEDATNIITLDKTGVQDAAGNTGTGTDDSNNYVIDTKRPTATVTLSKAALYAGETATVTITFSEAVTGFDNTDLTVPNGSLTAVSSADGGITFTGTFTANDVDDATNSIVANLTGVTDAAGNTGTGTAASSNYTVSRLAVPGAPTGVTATAGNGQATVSFTAPALDGGAAITSYTVTSNPGGITATGTASPITVTGLANGTAYTFTVTATNSIGSGAASAASISVTPQAVPYIGGGSTGGSDTGNTGSTDTNVEVNGDSYSAGTSETGTNASGQTVTTVTVDTDKLQDILENQGQGATVTIPVATGSTVASGVLTGDMVDTMEQNGATLVIDTGNATYTLPAEEININAVSEQLGENVSLGDITVTVSVSSPSDDMVTVVENTAENGGYTLVVPAVEFTVSCSYGDQTVDVTSFDTYVDRTIIIPDGVDPNQITTAIVVDPDGTTHSVPTNVFLTEEGLYAVRIRSLTNSVYTVIYNPVEFPDVENHWASDAINDMGSRMIVTGDLNGNFNPDNSITRAEFAAIMVRALGLAPGDGTNRFSDVVSSSWYCGYVKTATAYGIITGYDDGTFRPNDLITREQAMTMLARAMKITGLAPDVDAGAVLLNFNDGNTISNYAKNGVAACIETGVVTGKTAEMLAPKDSVTRAEVAVMVQRLLVQSGLI